MKISTCWLAAVLPLALLSSACQRSDAEEMAAPAVSARGDSLSFPAGQPVHGVSVASVAPAPVQRLVLPGRVVWNEDKTVRVFTPFSGRVLGISTDLGAQVSAGQPLAMIASPDFGQAQADAHKAAADMAVAQKNMSRQKDLFANGVAAEKEVEQAQADFAHAQAEQERVQALLRLFGKPAETVDQQFVLRSPIAGVVVERTLNPGQELRVDQSAAPLFVITDPTELWVQLDAGEAELPALHSGQLVELSSALYPGEVFQATLTRIADYVDPTTRTIRVRGRIANPDRRLKGEMFVTASVHAAATPALAVPAAAVFLYDNRHYLFVADGANHFTRREVTVLDQNDGHVRVRDGILDGEQIVTQGALYLQQVLVAANG